MTHKPTIERLRALFGVGNIQYENKGKRWRTAWHWTVRANEAAAVLSLILPYLFLKTTEAEVALRFADLPTSRHGQKRTPEHLVAAREAYYRELRALKVFDFPGPTRTAPPAPGATSATTPPRT